MVSMRPLVLAAVLAAVVALLVAGCTGSQPASEPATHAGRSSSAQHHAVAGASTSNPVPRFAHIVVVVEENPMVADVGEFVGIEEELCGAGLRSPRPFVAGVQVGGERAAIVA